MTGYDLSRAWFNFCFENPELIKPIHSAIFFFAVEHQNRLGGKEKFGFPSQMTMEAIGVKKHQTYSAALNDLEDWGFIVFIERSKNQYSANIISIALPENGIARDKALDKATIKHEAKQGRSNGQSNGRSKDSIVKPINQEPLTNKPINQEPKEEVFFPFDSKEFLNYWNIWKGYKWDEFKFKYKSVSSEQAALKKLNELSRGSEPLAIKIINQSLENGWKGFFELKNISNGKQETINRVQQLSTIDPRWRNR